MNVKLKAWDKKQKVFIPIVGVDDKFVYAIGRLKKNKIYQRVKKNYIVLQAINRKDIKGNEIWEGDIVESPFFDANRLKASKILGEVRYNNSYAQFYIYGINGNTLDYDFNREVEIVGNIYENPEMLD